jgi:hypothetical protein
MLHTRTSILLVALATGALACGDNLTLPPEREPAQTPPVPPLGCLPDLDGRIDGDEIVTALGTEVGFLVSPPGVERAVDLAGEDGEVEGERLWDFTVDYADDQALRITPTTLEGRWYASSFADGAFVTPFDASGTLENVLLRRDDALVLLGLASSEEAPPEGQTLLVYDPPITILRIPVEVGQSFVSTGEIVNGVIQGLPYAGRDTYEVSVDGMGRIDLPQLAFEQVHRVRTKVTVEPAVGAAVTRRQVSFFAECFAEVARATSRDGEESDDFTTTAELRRLGR